jgi:hypothetical protein
MAFPLALFRPLPAPARVPVGQCVSALPQRLFSCPPKRVGKHPPGCQGRLAKPGSLNLKNPSPHRPEAN